MRTEPAAETMPRIDEIRLDWQVVLFAIGLSLITGIAWGLTPAFAPLRTDANQTLKEGGRTGSAGGHSWLRSALVVGEIATALEEMAIRMALGSQRSGILGLVFLSAAKLALAGCALGLLAAASPGRWWLGCCPLPGLRRSIRWRRCEPTKCGKPLLRLGLCLW